MVKNKAIIDDIFDKIIPFTPKKDKCGYCGVVDAKWKNIVILEYSCDECVPRGCSCNIYKKTNRSSFSVEDYEYKKDRKGRDLPCEDWIKI